MTWYPAARNSATPASTASALGDGAMPACATALVRADARPPRWGQARIGSCRPERLRRRQPQAMRAEPGNFVSRDLRLMAAQPNLCQVHAVLRT